MPNATVVKAWQDETSAHLAVRVREGARDVEYIGTVPLAELEGKSNAEAKDALVEAVKAVRDGQQRAAPPALNITGNVTI